MQPGAGRHAQIRRDGGSDGGQGHAGFRKLFDDKVAQSSAFKYTSGGKERWAAAVRHYLIGRCADVKVFLKWAEDRQTRVITDEDVKNDDALQMLDVPAIELSSQVWAWLHLNLHEDNTRATLFSNVDSLNGAEIWRKIIMPINARGPEQRFRLRSKVHNPTRANKLDEVMFRIE